MKIEEKEHIPVLLKECIENLNIKKNGIYADLTFGDGGHSKAVLEKEPSCKVISFDKDSSTKEKGLILKNIYKDRFLLINDNFSNFYNRLNLQKITKIDGVILDLGISTKQILQADRGFSFSKNALLDMRMNNKHPLTAKEVINNYSTEKLANIFKTYGEENLSYKIAKKIVAEREKREIKYTLELAEIIESCVNFKQKLKSKARVFQALRIYINSELIELKEVLKNILWALNSKGRIVIISYHSLEDKIVKDFFNYEALDCICDSKLPVCCCNKKARLKIINKKPIIPSESEIMENNKARSAKLRIGEKI